MPKREPEHRQVALWPTLASQIPLCRCGRVWPCADAEFDAPCEDWIAACVQRVDGEPCWLDTPPFTHVSLDLLDEPGAREFLATRYEIGEACPRLAGVVHATRVTPPGETEGES
jgi:hypothetical protein